jgi:hypothetical protein
MITKKKDYMSKRSNEEELNDMDFIWNMRYIIFGHNINN